MGALVLKPNEKETVFPCSVKLCLPLILFVALIPAVADASGASHGHQVGFGEILLKMIPYWVNLIIFIAVLVLAGRKPLRNHLEQRRSNITKTIEAARFELQEINGAWQQMKARVASIETEQAKLAAEIASDGEAEAAQILREAQDRVKLIEQLSAFSIQSEKKAAEDRLQVELINVVIAGATEKLKQQLNVDTDRHIREAALQQVKHLNQ